MKLNVPIKRQVKGSFDCGIISLQMALEYFGIKKSTDDIRQEIFLNKVGSYAPQMGTFMIKNGFDVNIITQHPGIFTIHDRIKGQGKLLSHIDRLLKEEKNKQNKMVLEYFVEFLKYDGKIIVKIPNASDIRNSIKKKSLVLPLMTTRFLSNEGPKFNFHFNVITGIDKENIYYNDPAPGNIGGKKKAKITDFLFGLHTSSCGDLDNGSLLIVSKK